jgi:hypothetical protein
MDLIKHALVISTALALFVTAFSKPANAQVAASSSEANPYSSNLNNNSNTVYNVLPSPTVPTNSNTTVLSLTLSFGWSNTYVYPAAPVTCPIAVRANDVLSVRIPQGCPVPAVLGNLQEPNQTSSGSNPAK